MENIKDIKRSIEEFSTLTSHLLVIDGDTLEKIISNPEVMLEFFTVAKEAKSVCVCRCSPTQKAVVAKNIKKITGKRIACVGDGGNDVAMI
jgi:phospholipid-translocating ATPase